MKIIAIKTMMGATVILVGIFIISLTISEIPKLPPTYDNKFQVVQAGEMSIRRTVHQATILNSGKVLITGGAGAAGATAEIYDPSTSSFKPVANMKTSRFSHVAVTLNDGRILVAGGLSGNRTISSAEVYNPETEKWSSVKDLNKARSSPFATLLPDGRVLITGGWDNLTPLASAEIYDPATSSFTEIESMSTPRSGHATVALADGRVLVTGGLSTRGGTPLRSAEIFDPATGEFHEIGDMILPRLKHASTLLPDGKVIIIGGIDGSGTENFSGRYKSTEIYDPVTGEFSLGPNMQKGRFKIRDAIAVLPSGDVVIGGGDAQLEVFDYDNKKFVPVNGELFGPAPLYPFNTATLLHSGEVLVIGGSSAAWLVQPTK